MKYFCLLIAALLISGCADSSTKGDVKEIKAPVDVRIINNQGTIYLDPALGFEYAKGDTSQDTSNRSDLNPATTFKVPVAQGASTAVTGAAEGIANTLDHSQKNSNNDNSTSVNSLPGSGTNGDSENIPAVVNPLNTPFTMDYVEKHQRLLVWLPETGSYYGGSIKLTMPECKASLVVPDATDNFVPAEGIRYFCGTKNKAEEANGIRASVMGPVGCKTGTLVLTRL